MAHDILHLSPPSYHFFERIFREDNKHLDVPPCKEGGGLFTTVKRHGSALEICRIYLKRIEHVCFKFPKVLEQRAGKRKPGTTLVKQYRSGRGLDRQTHRADSHCDRDGYERALHRIHLLRLRERPLRQGVIMPCPLRALV